MSIPPPDERGDSGTMAGISDAAPLALPAADLLLLFRDSRGVALVVVVVVLMSMSLSGGADSYSWSPGAPG